MSFSALFTLPLKEIDFMLCNKNLHTTAQLAAVELCKWKNGSQAIKFFSLMSDEAENESVLVYINEKKSVSVVWSLDCERSTVPLTDRIFL